MRSPVMKPERKRIKEKLAKNEPIVEPKVYKQFSTKALRIDPDKVTVRELAILLNLWGLNINRLSGARELALTCPGITVVDFDEREYPPNVDDAG